MGEVTWPKNPKRKRYADQIVRDCLGKQVGNVPANLAGFFRKLLTLSTYVTHITCVSTGVKPRPSSQPPSTRKFKKSSGGQKDLRGGGLILDCRYELHLKSPELRPYVVYEVQKFLRAHDGDEEVQ